jgi:acyl-CoA thioester hydrolase
MSTNNPELTKRSPADGVYRDEFTVPTTDIDENGHVNNVSYVQWMQDVAIRHFAVSGGEGPMQDAGAMWVARSHHIEYLRPGFTGDCVQACTWIASFSRVRSVRRYKYNVWSVMDEADN